MGYLKNELLNYMSMYFPVRTVVELEEFETNHARHICYGTRQIKILQKEGMEFISQMNGLQTHIDFFHCSDCGKVFLLKSQLHNPEYGNFRRMFQWN